MTVTTAPGTTCYLYGIAAADLELPAGLSGLRDQPVAKIPYGDVAAIASPFHAEHGVAAREDVLKHGQVLDAIAAVGPVIPVRFGSALEDHAAVEAELLEPGHDRYRAMLGELRGHAQFTVRARYDERQILTEVVAENPAIAQLRASTRGAAGSSSYGDRVRLGELVARVLEAKSAADGEAILSRLEGHATAVSVRAQPGLDQLIDVALLVENSRRQEFEQAVESLATAFAGRARLRLVGPTAPYDFVVAVE